MREVYFHEDDYCQIELVAEANWQFCLQQMGEIDKFSEDHKDGIGWTRMYIRSENPVALATLAIGRSAFTESIPPSMPQYDSVSTGYSDYRVECKSTLAFGPHPSLTLFADLDDSDRVIAVWFEFSGLSVEDIEIALNLMRNLSRWPVAIADWRWSVLLRVSDTDGLTRYFGDR